MAFSPTLGFAVAMKDALTLVEPYRWSNGNTSQRKLHTLRPLLIIYALMAKIHAAILCR
jgi:hypothetical protein